jgi:hypothetical protein
MVFSTTNFVDDPTNLLATKIEKTSSITRKIKSPMCTLLTYAGQDMHRLPLSKTKVNYLILCFLLSQIR